MNWLESARAGNYEPMIQQFDRYIYKLMKNVPYQQKEDSRQAAILTMIQLVKTYDPNKSTFLHYIHNALKAAIYHSTIGSRRTSMEKEIMNRRMISIEELKETNPNFDVIDEDAKESIEKCYQFKGRLRAAIQSLTETQKLVIYFRYFEDKTLAEIGELIGSTRQYIGQEEKKAIDKMRKILCGKG